MGRPNAIILACAMLCAAPALAQTPSGEADVWTPPPPGLDASADGSVGTACVPDCRDGFTCVSGQCVSDCNPPCSGGSTCSAGACQPSYSQPNLYSERPADYPAPSPSEGAETHDGFMLRLTLGLGYGTSTESLDNAAFGREVTLSGLSGTFSLDLGGAPIDNFVIHGRIASFVVADPSVSVDGRDLGTAEDTSLGFVLYGAGVSYYLMPANVYFTAAAGLSRAQTTRGSVSANTDFGLGLNLDIGKEWWAGDNWGLGVAGRFWLSSLSSDLEDGGTSGSSSLLFTGFAITFSATYQ